jgi:hypothetical protein
MTPAQAPASTGTCAESNATTATTTTSSVGSAPPSPGPHWRDAALASVALALAAGGIAWIVRHERRRLLQRRMVWRPYWTGALLGVVFALSLTFGNHVVGVSGGVQHLAGLVGRRLVPASGYWDIVIPTGFTWSVWILVGVTVGGYLSAAFGGHFRPRVPGAKRWVLAFFAAALIEYAAAIAGGCTSGLALSGGIALAPGAFLFMAAMFATGIPTAWLLGRHR